MGYTMDTEKRDPLPRPTVTVTHASHATPEHPEVAPGSMDVVITAPGSKDRSYRVSGTTGPEIVKDAVEQVIGDYRTTELLPRSGEEKK